MKNRLRQFRELKRVTKTQMARDMGTTRQTIHNIEAERYNPSGRMMLRLARYFGVDVEALFPSSSSDCPQREEALS